MIKKIFIIILIGLKTSYSFSQNYNSVLYHIEKENQGCLDKGNKMYDCSIKYFKKSDSILNVVYQNVRNHLSDNEKLSLKTEQIRWVREKEKLFNGIKAKNSDLGNGLDYKMERIQKEADLTIERTKYLIKYKYDKISKKISSFVPNTHTLFSINYGDLNNDLLEDCVLIIKGTDKSKFVKDQYRGELDRNRRGVIILLNQGNNSFRQFTTNYDCFSSENEDGGVYFPPELSIDIENNKLLFHYSHGRYGYWKYQFRLKNNDLELIGYDSSYGGAVIESQTSINFLTKKKLYQKNINKNDEGGDEVFENIWSKIILQRPIYLSRINDFDELQMENY